jgi:hypothetical protein
MLRSSSRSTLKQSLNRILSACKRPTNQRLCKRFLSQLRSLFEDDYDDEENSFVGAVPGCMSIVSAGFDCKVDFECWIKMFEDIKSSCLPKIKSQKHTTEISKCIELIDDSSKCNSIDCVLGNVKGLTSCFQTLSSFSD